MYLLPADAVAITYFKYYFYNSYNFIKLIIMKIKYKQLLVAIITANA